MEWRGAQPWNVFQPGSYANAVGRKSESKVFSAIQALDEKTEALKISTGTKLDEFRKELIALLVAQSNSSTLSSSGGDDITSKLVAFTEEAENLERQQSFLEGLMFDSMKQRHDTIHKTHKKTDDWIFERPETGFRAWLESEGGIYWVKGKVSEYP